MRQNTKLALLSFVLICLFSPKSAKAQGAGIPTFDAAGYAQALEELARMQELISKAEEEIATLNNQYDAMTGSYGMSDLLNDLDQQNIRRYAPQNWQDTLDILNAGGNPGSLSDLQTLYQKNSDLFKHRSNADIYPDSPNDQSLATYSYARDTTLGSMALSETAFNHNDARITNYEGMIGQIDLAPDSKAAADLANRIAAENGLTTAELVRLQATQIQLNAAQANQDIRYESDLYEFSVGDDKITLDPINP